MEDKIIIITAPVPPPIHGMSLATSMLVEGLTSDFKPIVIDTAMDKNTIAVKQPSVFAPKRFLKIIYRLVVDSFRMLTIPYEIHYLCTGPDFRGIVRYLPYVVISRLKRKPYIIHVHNGSFRTMYNSLSNSKKRVIHFIFGKAAGVIALGDSLKPLFYDVVPHDRIFVVENCVDDPYIATPEEIEEKKHRDQKICKVLYLSNLMEDKGILELMDAMAELNDFELHLAGAIEQSEKTKTRVKQMLEEQKGKFFYHGIVSGDAKKKLLNECDIFALPSRYKVEGQPISILEAYANGLSVVTDPKCGGIADIFKDGVNGRACISDDAVSIRKAVIDCRSHLNDVIEPNYRYAISKFTRHDFVNRIERVFGIITK